MQHLPIFLPFQPNLSIRVYALQLHSLLGIFKSIMPLDNLVDKSPAIFSLKFKKGWYEIEGLNHWRLNLSQSILILSEIGMDHKSEAIYICVCVCVFFI